MKNPLLKQIGAAALLATLAHSASATVWMAVSATSGQYGTQSYPFGGAYFEDGKFSPSTSTPVVSASGGGSTTRFNFQNWAIYSSKYAFIQAPQVDLANMRADFSSLILYGWGTGTNPDADIPTIGWSIGSQDGWVPLIDNGNGTYTASWVSSGVAGGFGSTFYPVSMTISAVPESSSLAYLAIGMVGVGGLVRARRGKPAST